MKNKFLIFGLALFSVFLIPDVVSASRKSYMFKFNMDEDKFIKSSDLLKMQQQFPTSDFLNNKSWFVVSTVSGYSFYISNHSDNSLDFYSYYTGSYYNMSIKYDSVYRFDKDFDYLSYSQQSAFYTLYSENTPPGEYVDVNTDKDSLVSIDFPIVASNSTFVLRKVDSDFGSGNKDIAILGKNYSNGSNLIVLPFDEERNILLTDDSYKSSKTYKINSSDYQSVKIPYNVLEGTLDIAKEDKKKTWYEKLFPFFSFISPKTTTISVDNFNYTVTSPVNIPMPVRFYSTNGKKYKKLPSDFTKDNQNFYTTYVDSLNYKDGVRYGYIELDLSSLPDNTEIIFQIEYSSLSLKVGGLELNEDISSLTEFNFSNYYGIALRPKFDYVNSINTYPIFYKGDLAFGYIYNDDTEIASSNDDSKVGSAQRGMSTDKFSKYKLSFLDAQDAANQNIVYNNPYYFIKNLRFNKETNEAIIKYNPNYFELLTYSSSNSAVTGSDGHNYYSPVWSNPAFGTINPDGSTNNSTPIKDSSKSDSVFPNTLEGFISMIPDMIKTLAASFAVIGTMITVVLTNFPPLIVTCLYSTFLLGIIILILKALR